MQPSSRSAWRPPWPRRQQQQQLALDHDAGRYRNALLDSALTGVSILTSLWSRLFGPHHDSIGIKIMRLPTHFFNAYCVRFAVRPLCDYTALGRDSGE